MYCEGVFEKSLDMITSLAGVLMGRWNIAKAGEQNAGSPPKVAD